MTDPPRYPIIDAAFQDFRYAIRQLRNSPGFACTAAFVLALGITAAVSIFGLAEAALIKPLPYRDQSRLVSAFASAPGNPRCPLPYQLPPLFSRSEYAIPDHAFPV